MSEIRLISYLAHDNTWQYSCNFEWSPPCSYLRWWTPQGFNLISRSNGRLLWTNFCLTESFLYGCGIPRNQSLRFLESLPSPQALDTFHSITMLLCTFLNWSEMGFRSDSNFSLGPDHRSVEQIINTSNSWCKSLLLAHTLVWTTSSWSLNTSISKYEFLFHSIFPGLQ